jgi:hypothetical protein
MTTFRSQQSDRGQRVRQEASANAFQIHLTNCARNLRRHVHEARKIVCNKLQGAVQEHVIELSFYTREALPLVGTRILRLAENSPMAARSPVRRPRDVRESSGKTSGGISCAMSAQLPGNGRAVATAIPPNVRQATRKTTGVAPKSDARWPRRKLARQLATWSRNSRAAVRATVKRTSRKTTRSNLNHDIQKL